jgi:thiamine biosynthesis protein ThiI
MPFQNLKSENSNKQPKAICLISDGIDSPVAAFLVAQKKVEIIGLHFDNYPMIKPVRNEHNDFKKQISNIAQQLTNSLSFQESFELYTIPNGNDLKIIATSNDPKITCLLCKRLMLQKAEFLAVKLGADYLVTGEILGEQASQTINNLYNIQEVVKKKQLLRPIVGLNKDEVTKIARNIGTLPFSEKAAAFTCSAVPNKPAIQAELARIHKLEKELSIKQLVNQSVEQRKKTIFKRQK